MIQFWSKVSILFVSSFSLQPPRPPREKTPYPIKFDELGTGIGLVDSRYPDVVQTPFFTTHGSFVQIYFLNSEQVFFTY